MENNMLYQIKGRNLMKTVDVIFVSDELVGSTIVSKKEYERLLKQKVKTENEKPNILKKEESEVADGLKTPKRKICKNDGDNSEIECKRMKYVDDVELALAALENDDVEKVDVNHPTTLFDEDDVLAKKICNFENSISNSVKSKKGTDSASNIKSNMHVDTEKHKNRKSTSVLDDPQTPFTLRKRVIKDIKAIQKILENSDDDFSASDSDSSFKMSDDSFSDDNKNAKKSCSRSSKSFFQNYCDLQSSKKSINSVNVLKKIKTSKITQEKLDEIVKNVEISSVHKKCIKSLFSEILNMFNKWDFILKQNYNVLLYGAGSKREVLSKFVSRHIDVSPVIVVNGFFPDITIKEIIEKICSILNIKVETADSIETIKHKIINYDIEIYLAINNIDGVMLRNKKVQNTLSQLGKIEQIHIIASIDHINAPLIWDKRTNSEFNWVWFDSTTFLNYTEETLYEGNLMLQNSGKATLTSLRNVFNALTKNSQGIFLIMLKNQLQAGNKKTGISFRELYEECRRELLISSDVALRAQLKEFIDHMILKQKTNADREEQFVIVMENSILKQFLEERESQES